MARSRNGEPRPASDADEEDAGNAAEEAPAEEAVHGERPPRRAAARKALAKQAKRKPAARKTKKVVKVAPVVASASGAEPAEVADSLPPTDGDEREDGESNGTTSSDDDHAENGGYETAPENTRQRQARSQTNNTDELIRDLMRRNEELQQQLQMALNYNRDRQDVDRRRAINPGVPANVAASVISTGNSSVRVIKERFKVQLQPQQATVATQIYGERPTMLNDFNLSQIREMQTGKNHGLLTGGGLFDAKRLTTSQKYADVTIGLIDKLVAKCTKFDPAKHRDFNVHLKRVHARIGAYALDAAVMRQLLPETLDGAARDFYDEVLVPKNVNYTELCEQLLDQFTPTNIVDLYERQLRQDFKSTDNMMAFMQRKFNAVCALYPHHTDDNLKVCKRIAYEKVLETIGDRAQKAAEATDYGDFDALVNWLNKAEIIRRSLGQRFQTPAAAAVPSSGKKREKNSGCRECGSLTHWAQARCPVYLKRVSQAMASNGGELPEDFFDNKKDDKNDDKKPFETREYTRGGGGKNVAGNGGKGKKGPFVQVGNYQGRNFDPNYRNRNNYGKTPNNNNGGNTGTQQHDNGKQQNADQQTYAKLAYTSNNNNDRSQAYMQSNMHEKQFNRREVSSSSAKQQPENGRSQ